MPSAHSGQIRYMQPIFFTKKPVPKSPVNNLLFKRNFTPTKEPIMRCILGIVLCFVFAYCGIESLYHIATAVEKANNPGISQRAAQAVGWKVVGKYHAVVYVVAGLTSLTFCCLPTLLGNRSGFNEAEEWRRLSKSEQI
jgi:hypothetical protein